MSGYKVLCGVDELGGLIVDGSVEVGEYATMSKAVAAVRTGVRPGRRGVGCFAILSPDGGSWSVESEYGSIVEQYGVDGTLLRRCDIDDFDRLAAPPLEDEEIAAVLRSEFDGSSDPPAHFAWAEIEASGLSREEARALCPSIVPRDIRRYWGAKRVVTDEQVVVAASRLWSESVATKIMAMRQEGGEA